MESCYAPYHTLTADWATHVDMETGRPVENPDVVYEVEPQWIIQLIPVPTIGTSILGQRAGTDVLLLPRHRQLLSLDEGFVELVLMRFAKRS